MPQLLTRSRTYRWVHAGDRAHRICSDAPHVGDVGRAACGQRVTVSRSSTPLSPCPDCSAGEQRPRRRRVVLDDPTITVLSPATLERIAVEGERR